MTALPDPDMQPEFYSNVTAKRLVAFVVDSLLITVIAALIVPFTGFLGLFVWPALYLTVGFIYRTVTLSNHCATWGMRVAGIELRTSDGSRLESGDALMHTLGYTVSMAFPILQVISIVMMLISTYGQGLTDHILGTVMLKRRS